ncbi:PREDICTED: uncharacterized protein LOC105313003 [Amphimedon queenslandica]|uniref:Helitron helicase-like domain-containing protein n=1 Tax=Amphimedon queenslandica TaxID=400682 RepID=A0AAN0IMS9_AMPQE|nr:PREDICTED: uncharacterized protein LOC105313003 [Amphimedon queenslandica]|eukprot:XP_011404395.1 PREDICTED: uncharacterized protein LOC105313003 [Amphimedon queenslandica]
MRREQEEPAEREQQLAGNRARVTLMREQEEPAEREQRVAGERARVTRRREQEEPAGREQRLAGERTRIRVRREEEEPAQRDHRLTSERSRSQRRRLEDHEQNASNMLKFHEGLSFLTSAKCDTCLERFPTLSVTSQPNGINECSRCARDKSIPNWYSSANNIPWISTTTVAGPQSNRGNADICYVHGFATTLPRLPSEIDILVVRKEKEQTHRDFRVHRRAVEEAITWLLANNIYYRGIGVIVDQDTLASLSEGRDLTVLRTIQPAESQKEVTPDDFTTEEHYSSSFVRNAAPPATQRETIEQAVQSLGHSQSSHLMWPSIGGTPINEFQTEGYFSIAFPTLFPTGAANFNGIRMNSVTVGNYFTHLMKYDNGRFAKHPRFRFLALNTEMRWRANETGQIYIRQHSGEAHLTIDDLRDMIGREGESFSNKVVYYGASLRGTRLYWFRERNHFIAMIDTLGLPTIFFTHSAADHQWPELASLICPEDPDDKQARVKAVINHNLTPPCN